MSKKSKPSIRQPSLLPKHPVPKIPKGYYSSGPNPTCAVLWKSTLLPTTLPQTNTGSKPFDKPFTTTKATAIYNMHTYWSKKPHDAMHEYIEHYTKPGDIALDPFCDSSGTTWQR